MVGHNWFLPEALTPQGGVPLTTTKENYEGLPLFLGHPSCALHKTADGVWKTSVDASGILLCGLGQFPLRIDLPGSVAVVVTIEDRPAQWRREVAGTHGSGLTTDSAITLTIFLGSTVVAQWWSEWSPPWGDGDGQTSLYYGDDWQLGAGWNEDGTVYVHFLPFALSGGLYPSSAINETAQFGIGFSDAISLPGVFPGPARISVTGSVPYLSQLDQPCSFFTGHSCPLGKSIPYLPDELTPAQRLAQSPSDRFGWFGHVAPFVVGHSARALTFSEADYNYELAAGGKDGSTTLYTWLEHSGPRHLAARHQYRFSDHAVVPDDGDAQCNLSATRAHNVQLRRLRIKWTVDWSHLWTHVGYAAPAGQFVFESILSGHGAWCEWATAGFVATSQTASSGGRHTDVTAFAMSAMLRRHTTASNYAFEEPSEVERLSHYELGVAIWCKGRSRVQVAGTPNTDTPWEKFTRVTTDSIFLLWQGDMDALFDGDTVVIDHPYSPSGAGVPLSLFGSLEVTGLGP